MKRIDITIDLETCSLAPNAAIMQLAAVAWDRECDCPSRLFEEDCTLNVGIDLRSCFMGGFNFDTETSEWWSKQDAAVCEGILSLAPTTIKEAMSMMSVFVEDAKSAFHADDFLLWSQGTDFDLPILRNAISKTGVPFGFHYANARDARTMCLETALMLLKRDGTCDKPSQGELYNRLTSGFERPVELTSAHVHDALFDARRTAFNTWCAFHCM